MKGKGLRSIAWSSIESGKARVALGKEKKRRGLERRDRKKQVAARSRTSERQRKGGRGRTGGHGRVGVESSRRMVACI